MSNADNPVNPITDESWPGMTIREHFCLHAGVPATGDDELDAIIREGERRRMVREMAAACRCRPTEYKSWNDLALDAIELTDALLAELEKGEG